MFNKNFYPSPDKVIAVLMAAIPSRTERILEPSAGKGDIADALRRTKYHKVIECIESEPELAMILSEKEYPVISSDFLTFNTNSEYDAIIMNPPFEKGDEHLLHAIKVAERQVYRECTISCILNAETIKNPYSKSRQQLIRALKKYGAKITFHERLFSSAERKTDIETAVISLTISVQKMKVGNVYQSIINSIGINKSSENIETALSTVLNKQEVVNRVKDIQILVKQYEYHVELLRNKFKAIQSLNYLEKMIFQERNTSLSTPTNFKEYSFDEGLERLRKEYWEEILSTNEFASKLTTHGKNNIWKMIEQTKSMEITLENVEMLLLAVFQNSNNLMLDCCIHLFKDITKYHNREYSSNVHYYSGWDTNDAFKINKKIIRPFYADLWWSWGDSVEFDRLDRSITGFITDMTKAFKLLKPDLSVEMHKIATMEFECELFRFKVFKKGTVHIWFKDLELLDQFNVICGQHFNWIPSDEEVKNSKKAKGFMKQNFGSYYKTKGLDYGKA